MDLVITYVDNSDKEFIKNFNEYKKIAPKEFNINVNRIRSYGTMNYWFRLVNKFMPFIDKIHLVVQSKSQVPKDLDQSKFNVVTHDQIIPKNLLPVYNSTAIEMYLWKIPGLSEEFIYSNDDMYPIGNLKSTDFFVDGKPCMMMKEFSFSQNNVFRNQIYNSFELVKTIHKTDKNLVRPIHGMTTFLKSNCEYIYNKFKSEIDNSITSYRVKTNFTQYLYMYDNYFKNFYISKSPSLKYISLSESKILLSSRFPHKILCVNDDSTAKFHLNLYFLTKYFSNIAPNKCKYEL